MAKRTPSVLSACMAAMHCSTSSSRLPSVISSSRRPAGTPWRCRALLMRSTKPGLRSSRGLTLIASTSQGESSCQRARQLQARSSIQSESSRISPVSSANGMNCAGGISPRLGWCQRISASAPITRPSDRASCGWNSRLSWSRSMAWRSSLCNCRRWSMAACISGAKKCSALRPDCLARYIAVSACLSTSAAPCSVKGCRAMPILAVTTSSCSPMM
ncbi:hypothetical protein D9M68_630190 [compost metagenome]